MSDRNNHNSRPVMQVVLSAVLAAIFTLAVFLPSSAAAAATTHVFDARLSLTGDCTTYPGEDEIPDPGLCPMPPGVKGVDHPTEPFFKPRDVATDAYGNLYVATFGENGAKSPIDIFDSSGRFITAIESTPELGTATSIAVDGAGHLYAYLQGGGVVSRFDPTTYDPAQGEIAYANPPTTVINKAEGGRWGVRVDAEGHLFVAVWREGGGVREYGSFAEGNAFIANIGATVLKEPIWMGIDASAGRLYVSDSVENRTRCVVRVFDLNTPGDPLLATIGDSNIPEGEGSFNEGEGSIGVAVDESDHHLFVRGEKSVFEFTDTGAYVGKIEHFLHANLAGPGIVVDNGSNSPNRGYLYVPSGQRANAHLYAFAPISTAPPVVETLPASGVGTGEATLHAKVNPSGAPTEYSLQLVTQQAFEAEGFQGASTVGEGQLAPGKEAVAVSAAALDLVPGTAYRFRVVATNSCESNCGQGEAQGAFATYPLAPASPSCPNAALRTGPARALPDCRAYELVTPPSTNGRLPITIGMSPTNGEAFGSSASSPDGAVVSFLAAGGAIPGFGGTGTPQGDSYLARRTATGWQTEYVGPSATEATAPLPESPSADFSYAGWRVPQPNEGTLVDPQESTYVRHPDGSFHRLGVGSLGTDPLAKLLFIAPRGAHIVFGHTLFPGQTQIQLEPDAPPSGTSTIYDRTPDEVTHVVSLLPGDITPAAGEDAAYRGASPDGSAIAFTIAGTLYERLDDEETLEVAKDATFAGISEAGTRVFYLAGGDLYAFDAGTEATTRITETGDAVPVNVSRDGSRAYFVSGGVIDPTPNSHGEEAEPGKENLYLWGEGGVRYVATLTERDVAGIHLESGPKYDGLGLWLEALRLGGTFSLDPSRTNPDGQVLLLTSRANLTGYESGGKAEIYRYDAGSDRLSCLSCLPTMAPATGDASLALPDFDSLELKGSPTAPSALIANLSLDGDRAFFQTPDALVPRDNDNLQDVYEWEADGKGTCATEGGCVTLLSSGQSSHPNYLYGASESGDDVFISSSDLLTGEDHDETPSIYDARVKGGFAPAPAREECLGEACQPVAVPPAEPTLSSASFEGPGNVVEGAKQKPKHKKKHGKHKKTKASGRAHR